MKTVFFHQNTNNDYSSRTSPELHARIRNFCQGGGGGGGGGLGQSDKKKGLTI